MAAVKKLDVHTASTDYSKTYVFHEEDHTLGNALRHVLMRKRASMVLVNQDALHVYVNALILCECEVILTFGAVIVRINSPDVDFCGYTIPHPSEPKMHVRLQTRLGVPSDEALRSGLTDLRKVSSTISDAYRKELKAFNRKRKN